MGEEKLDAAISGAFAVTGGQAHCHCCRSKHRQQALLEMQPIRRLLEHHAPRPVDHLVGNLHPPIRRQTVHHHRVLRRRRSGRTSLRRLRLPPLRRRGLLVFSPSPGPSPGPSSGRIFRSISRPLVPRGVSPPLRGDRLRAGPRGAVRTWPGHEPGSVRHPRNRRAPGGCASADIRSSGCPPAAPAPGSHPCTPLANPKTQNPQASWRWR